MSLGARLLVPAAVAIGCGGSSAAGPTAPAPSAEIATPVGRFMPLEGGTVYSYKTTVENTGEHGLLVMRIERPRAEMAELVVGGRKQRIEIAPDGLRLATGGYVLKVPLALDATWRGQAGQVRVSAVDKAVSVPAGQFVGCLETVEVSPGGEKRITTVYCPDVGMVTLDVEGVIDGEYGRETAVLEAFGPAVDLGADETIVTPGHD
jgi:hypothetical protein